MKMPKAALMLGLLALALGANSRAATLFVDRTDDPPIPASASACTSASGDCSLRGAAAVIYSAQLAGTPGPFVIQFDPTVFARRQTIALESDVNVENISVLGPSAGVTLTSQSGTVFTLEGGGSELQNLIFANCSDAAIYRRRLGALLIAGLVLRDCTFRDNRTGIESQDALELSIQNCTFSGNGFGLFLGGGVAQVRNCTVSGNANGFILISFGGPSQQLNLSNSIVAGNQTNIGVYRDAAFNDQGHNILNVSAAQAGLDPSGLRENGGPTPTIALLPGSRAVDKGDTSLKTDQRGVSRPQGSAPDIGAFELQSSAPVLRAPTNLKAVRVGNAIRLTWTDNSQGELGYKIERRVSAPSGSFPFAEIFRGATPNQTTFTDANVLPNATYTYRVRAYASGQNGSYSNEASITLSR